jgi:cardiolipin synthase
VKWKSALLLVDLKVDAMPSVATLLRVAPGLERLLLVVYLPAPTFAWLAGSAPTEPDAETMATVEALRSAAAQQLPSAQVEVQLAPELSALALAELAITVDAELLVAGSHSRKAAAVLAELGQNLSLPVLFPEPEERTGAVCKLTCVALSDRQRASIGVFLRDHGDPTLQVEVFEPQPAPDDLEVLLEVAGIEADVEHVREPFWRSLAHSTSETSIDLLVLVRAPTVHLVAQVWPASVLVLPELGAAPSPNKAIDLADLVDLGGPLRARVDALTTIGELPPIAEERLGFVTGGRVVATALTTRAGELELPAEIGASSLGVLRGDGTGGDPLAAMEARIVILRPSGRTLVLFDAALPEEALPPLIERADRSGHELLAVRLRPTHSCRSIRERLRGLALPGRVIDARAVLDEGEALDLSKNTDPVRLARVADRLRAAGFRVAEPEPLPPVEPIGGNRIELEIDNTQARRWLLEVIHESRETLHLQVYIALDDPVGREVEAALVAAGARGVVVRVLVDSLHALHGSFGAKNPLLSRLAESPGVEVRTTRPITELPSLEDLKQRDHRKLVIADGRVALIGGRNLSYEYYTGFSEAKLTPQSEWREVPWLDAGAKVEGPAVGALAASFLGAWTEAGGAPFEISTPPVVGDSTARVLIHRGLQEARTLEAYRALIDGAREHLYVVNGFPLVLELQHALLAAIQRGVQVKLLIGHVSPTYGGHPFEGSWGLARDVANDLVHSRADALVERGAQVYHFKVTDQPGWDPGLGPVHPHVHAKLCSFDGQRATVGSANLDVTSSYWESELLLVLDDPRLALGLEAQIEALLAGADRVDPKDPKWQEGAHRRSWMRHWPGVLSV